MYKLSNFVKKYLHYYIAATAFLTVSTILDMKVPLLTGQIIDDVILGGNLEIFKTLIVTMAIITTSRAVLGYFKETSFDMAGMNVVTNLRDKLYKHILSLDLDYFNNKNTGELMARIKDDARNIRWGISFGIGLAIEATLYFFLSTYNMFRISPLLSIISIVSVPIIGFLALKLEKKIDKTYGEISEQNAVMNTTAQESIAGMRLVKAFAREKHEISKFLKENESYYNLNVKLSNAWSGFYPPIEFMSNILPILVITLGGILVIRGTLTIGQLIAFSGYIYMLVFPMRILGWLANILAETFASNKKIKKIFEETEKVTNIESPKTVDCFGGNVTFENVCYDVKEQKILKDITFKLKKGNTLGIMGVTGSGKTSIINLINRFMDATSGKILIEGTDIKEIDIKCLRDNIGLVMQDIFLFSDTIEENLRFGQKDKVNEKAMTECSSKAQIHEFISQMKDKYSTVIGEKGIGLSGGQKQRLTIARALAKNASLLILDDSTSALDLNTEQKIQNEINKLKDVSKIIIGHRISSVKDADEIIILEDGIIVERGDHESLMQQRGRYFETFIEQYEYEEVV